MRIGNAQDANGRKFITGISAINDSSVIASDIVAIENGSGILMSSSVDGVLVVSANFAPLVDSIESRVLKPVSGNISGMVLATNGDGTTSWVTNGGESVPWTKLSSKPATIEAMPSAVGTSGQFIQAVYNGSMVWKSFDANVTSDSLNAPTASAVDKAMSLHANANGMHLPYADVNSRGKVLKVNNLGNPTWATDLTLEGSAVLPSYDALDAGKVLMVADGGMGTEWGITQAQHVEQSLISGANPVAGSAIYNAIQGRMPAIDPTGRAGHVMAVNQNGNGYALSAIVQSSVNAVSAVYAVSALNGDTANVNAHISSAIIHVPLSGAVDGKVLKMVSGIPAWSDDATVNVSDVLPEYGLSDAGKVLAVNNDGTGTLWKENTATVTVASEVTQHGMNPPTASAVYQFVTNAAITPSPYGGGDMTIASFVSPLGDGVVRSAAYATSAVYVNGHTVSANVPQNATFTDTIPGSGVLTINADESPIGTFNANASTNSTITIPKATSTIYGLAKVETAIANTTNAVANAVVSAISATMSLHVDSSIVHVPYANATNNGQVLKVENGVPVWGTDLTGGGSAVLPSYGVADANKVLKVNGDGNGTLWASDIGGGAEYVSNPLTFGATVAYNGESAVSVIAGNNIVLSNVNASTVSINATGGGTAEAVVIEIFTPSDAVAFSVQSNANRTFVYAGTTSGAYVKGHLYQVSQQVNENFLQVTHNATDSIDLSGTYEIIDSSAVGMSRVWSNGIYQILYVPDYYLGRGWYIADDNNFYKFKADNLGTGDPIGDDWENDYAASAGSVSVVFGGGGYGVTDITPNTEEISNLSGQIGNISSLLYDL